MILYENNCIDKCPDKFYLDENKQCKPCNNLCLNHIDNNCTQCTSCIDGFYLKKNSYECEKCNHTCKTCEQEEEIDNAHCTSCDVNSEYKYLVNADGFGKNCVNICPNKTILKEGKCIKEEKKEEGKEEEEESNSLAIIIPSIIGGIIVIAVIILLIYLYYKKRSSNKIDENQLIKGTNQEMKVYESLE